MIAQIDSKYIQARPFKLWSRLLSYGLFEGRPLTTRGQWINPLVFFHFAMEKRLPAFKDIEKPVFILGTGRSGTTILGIVLSMHREVAFLNEPKALWHAIHPEEDLIGSYSRGIAHYRLRGSDATAEMKQSAHRLYGAYLASTFSRRVLDKYPELIFRVSFVKEIFPDAKFLFLVRSGWDTCHSIELWSERLGREVSSNNVLHDWWGADRRKWNLLVDQIVPEHDDLESYAEIMRDWTSHTDMAAVEWIVSMREGLKLLEKYPNDVLSIRYEMLCNNPRKEFAKIAKFADLKQNDEKFYQYAEDTMNLTTPKPLFHLHSCIEGPFLETMLELGYPY